ncbi:hypothetical protein MCELHM10_00868 [Paracoccaceae bacterium]|jgi:hypothetical protein
MNSPIGTHIWQAFAQGPRAAALAFAIKRNSDHCFHAGQRLIADVLHCTSCLPSPFLRSGLSLAGPTLSCGRGGADFTDHFNIHFEIPVIAVESGSRTTNQRGSSKCGNPLSSSPSSPPLCQAACRIQRRAAWQERRLARWSPMQPRAMSLPGLLSVDLRASRPVASNLACRPATRATDPLTDLVAFGRTDPHSRTIRADRPGGPLFFR